MGKAFFDVFPTLRVNRQLSELFAETQVEKLTTDRMRTALRIRLSSRHLIHRRYADEMQREIARQVLKDTGRKVLITERYELSSQYTPRHLMDAYRDSIAYEINGFSPVLGRVFREAKISYPDGGHVVLTLHDNCFARDGEERLLKGLTSIFEERCGVPAEFSVDYTEEKTKHIRRMREDAPMPVPMPAEDDAPDYAPDDTPDYVPDYVPDPQADGGYPAAGAPVDLPWDDAGSAGQSFSTQAENAPQAAAPAEAPAAEAGKDSGGKGAGKAQGRGRGSMPLKRSDNPDVIYGREVDGTSVQIADIVGEIGETVIRGSVMDSERRDIRNNKTIIKFSVTDDTDSIYCKVFVSTDDADEFLSAVKTGTFLRIKGVPTLDAFDHELVMGHITGIMKIPSFRTMREDHYEMKRIELHCHTKMSDMDGVSECKDLVKRAYRWGMPAIAITDHGNVQAFPDANHARDDLLSAANKDRESRGLEKIDKKDFFKVIYGVECYLVDDIDQCVVIGEKETKESSLRADYVVFDLETTGFSPTKNKIIEIGAVKIENGEITDRFSEFVNPGEPIPYRITQLTGITDSMVSGAESIEQILPRFLEFCKGTMVVGHNVGFDVGFVRENARRQGLPFAPTSLDTAGLARVLLPGHARYTLDAVAKLLGVSLEHHHRAVDDAEATAGIFRKELERILDRGVETLGGLEDFGASTPEIIKHLHTNHCVLLAKNETGRVNLYTMISESHLKYFAKRPRIPKSLLMKHREGILVGSACVSGELMEALLEGRGDEQIAKIVDFYDYLEIQPRDNNRFLLAEKFRDRYPDIRTEEDLLNLNRRVVQLGEAAGKPVVATGDVHFMDPEDEIYRTIIQDGMGMSEEEPAPLYFRTTDEMMEEFAYLGQRKAEEVVILNTHKIADQIEAISPVRPDKCPPVIPNSDETLRRICYDKAHSMYGDPLPQIVSDRLEHELNSIIKNGYSVMYIIAQKLVWKSVEDGYLVGSRGSVGSSFAATMAGITEVNPLAPHYYCPNCFYSDFDSPEVLKYRGGVGFDMPDRLCPHCGKPLKKDGFDIPFETFLGFKGDKEPDIDLNFSGEYQSKAHAYTKVIFGHEQTFKAGTIATVAEKTAYGYVKNYFERKGIEKRRCEIERLLKGCTGIRRSTGQHPGGIVVLPMGEDINTFTPVQNPANDAESGIVTTHFDYHSIDHNLLKLDILGHDDPTMIRMLQDLTGVDPMTIPIHDDKVLSLFSSTEALGITTEENGGIDLGVLGVPEMGTKFVIGMLDDTRPTTVAELIRISGLSHGTDVWLGNAQELIKDGKATLSTAICTRDDIMTYLIMAGVEKSMSFKIMESVRKGKGLKPEMREAMEEAGVPDWYVDSCLKIKYMFPRAHAAAYVMMALRIAWFKVYHPLAYYAAYFSIRASAFSYEIMCRGQEALLYTIEDYTRRKDTLSNKEKDTLDDMYLVREMYARGFEFMPIDIMRAKARSFQIIDGKLMPSLTSIDNMGEKAADAVEEAAKDGPFISRDDFRIRTRVSQTVIDKMHELGLFGDLPETNQISLFDLFGG